MRPTGRGCDGTFVRCLRGRLLVSMQAMLTEATLHVARADRLHGESAQALLRLPARRARAIALRNAAVGAAGASTICRIFFAAAGATLSDWR